MNSKEKLNYFQNHLHEIWGEKNNSLASFITECLNEKKLKKAFESWPEEIKVKVVERHLKETEVKK